MAMEYPVKEKIKKGGLEIQYLSDESAKRSENEKNWIIRKENLKTESR